MILKTRQKYLQIALNSSVEEAMSIINQLSISDRILIEVGTPLIKIYGAAAINKIRSALPLNAYVVADTKCADLASRDVKMVVGCGAQAATCLGVAPVETIDNFIDECKKNGIDSMIDMMNVDDSISVLSKLQEPPDIVILHRGVDETEFSREKQIPFYQINQIKANFETLVSVAGGDTIDEIQRAIFNDADIVVVWKSFYQSTAETAKIASDFIKEIR